MGVRTEVPSQLRVAATYAPDTLECQVMVQGYLERCQDRRFHALELSFVRDRDWGLRSEVDKIIAFRTQTILPRGR